MPVLLDRISNLVQIYEDCLNQEVNGVSNDLDLKVLTLSTERKLAYLMQVSNALFSYGLPSSSAKLPLRYATQ